MNRIAATLLLFFGLLAGAWANEAAIRRSLEPKMGGAKIQSVAPSNVVGLYEVQYLTAEGVQIVYTDATGTYVIQGNLFDIRRGRDITEEKLRRLNAVPFEKLPFDLAVKIQRGNGKRVLAMFTDPYCPYCQRFEKALQEIDDITVYVFMMPIIRPANADHSRAVWCSPDRAKAWLELALHHKPPAAVPNCDNPVDKTVELGHALKVRSTPTVFLSNGERFSGALGSNELRQKLDSVAAAPATR